MDTAIGLQLEQLMTHS